MGYLIGVDIGGTFTDCAVVDDEGAVTVGKAPTTPADPSQGFFASIDAAAGELGLDRATLLGATDRTSQTSPLSAVTVVPTPASMPGDGKAATSANTCGGTATPARRPLSAVASRALANSTTLRCMTVARWSSIADWMSEASKATASRREKA